VKQRQWNQPSRIDRLERARRLDEAAVAEWWRAGRLISFSPALVSAPAATASRAAVPAAATAWSNSPVPAESPPSQPTAGRAYDGQRHLLLGLADGQAWFTDLTDDSPTQRLRQLLPLLPAAAAELATLATALVAWHRSAGFCPRCGQATVVYAAGASRWCPGCAEELFPRTDPAVIVAVTDDTDRLLLAHQSAWQPGRFSILAGFVEAGESLEQAVHREVAEETGLSLDRLRYVASQPWPLPRSLMLGFRAHAASGPLRPDGVEISQARWFSRLELSQAVANQSVSLPGSASIADHLIRQWWEEG